DTNARARAEHRRLAASLCLRVPAPWVRLVVFRVSPVGVGAIEHVIRRDVNQVLMQLAAQPRETVRIIDVQAMYAAFDVAALGLGAVDICPGSTVDDHLGSTVLHILSE